MKQFTLEVDDFFSSSQEYQDRVVEWLRLRGISEGWVHKIDVTESIVDLTVFQFTLTETGQAVKVLDHNAEMVRTKTVTLAREDFPVPSHVDWYGTGQV